MRERLNTQSLIDLLVSNQGLDRNKTEIFIKEFLALIEEGLERDKSVKIKGFGTFKLIDVDSRESVNVNTGERIKIEGHTKISFTPDPTLKDIINKPFAHFETVVLNDNVTFNDMEEEVKENSGIEENGNEDIQEDMAQPMDEGKPLTNKETQEGVDKEREESEGSQKENEEMEEDEEEDDEEEETKSSSNVLIIVVVLAILLCGTLLFFTYFDNIFPSAKMQPAETPTIVEDSVPGRNITDSIATNDSIETKPIQDSIQQVIKTEEAVTKPTTTSPKIPFSKIPVKPDSTNYLIVGTKTVHTVKYGETLIRLSYRYYGTKDLYLYIIRHNRSTITNPNNVPIGTVLNIPELKRK